MAKWLIWTLLEFSTFMVVATAVILWLSRSLKKRLKPQWSVLSKDALSEERVALQENYKHLVHYLDQQIAFAANAILSAGLSQPSSTNINRFKLWGTVLKAERAILLNEVSEHPKPILNRFLSSLLFAVHPSLLKEKKINDLDQTLKDTGAAFFLMGKRLVVKENLSKSQFLLNEDLRRNISRAEKRLAQLQIKKQEQKRLQIDIVKLQNLIKVLTDQQNRQEGNLPPFNLQITETVNTVKRRLKHPSLKQITTLNSLAKRQVMVIDQLKIELDRAHKNNNHVEAAEIKGIALRKMERMCRESQSLTLQLEAELQSSNLTIASLEEDLHAKEVRLAAVEKQLMSKNETAISTLQALNANKKETLGSLRHGVNRALERESSNNLLEQDKDANMLERLLQESETCVTLLVQELEIAEEKNNQLKREIDVAEVSRQDSQTSRHQSLIEQREKNRQLVQATTELKEKIIDQASSSGLQELRAIFNRKSLEFDRLQLAYTDLEKKYLRNVKKS